MNRAARRSEARVAARCATWLAVALLGLLPAAPGHGAALVASQGLRFADPLDVDLTLFLGSIPDSALVRYAPLGLRGQLALTERPGLALEVSVADLTLLRSDSDLLEQTRVTTSELHARLEPSWRARGRLDLLLAYDLLTTKQYGWGELSYSEVQVLLGGGLAAVERRGTPGGPFESELEPEPVAGLALQTSLSPNWWWTIGVRHYLVGWAPADWVRQTEANLGLLYRFSTSDGWAEHFGTAPGPIVRPDPPVSPYAVWFAPRVGLVLAGRPSTATTLGAEVGLALRSPWSLVLSGDWLEAWTPAGELDDDLQASPELARAALALGVTTWQTLLLAEHRSARGKIALLRRRAFDFEFSLRAGAGAIGLENGAGGDRVRPALGAGARLRLSLGELPDLELLATQSIPVADPSEVHWPTQLSLGVGFGG